MNLANLDFVRDSLEVRLVF